MPTAELFEAVTREVGLRCDADLARMERFEPDRTVTAVAAWSRSGEAQLAVGTRFALEGASIAAQVLRDRPAGPRGHVRGRVGADRAGGADAGHPLVGRLPDRRRRRGRGGVIAASTRRATPFPPNTESRIADFTELVATAVSNAEARADLVASRARLLTAGDEARRRVVRDLHDGAQQRLVHTILTLKLAQGAHGRRRGGRTLVGEALDGGRAGERGAARAGARAASVGPDPRRPDGGGRGARRHACGCP